MGAKSARKLMRHSQGNFPHASNPDPSTLPGLCKGWGILESRASGTNVTPSPKTSLCSYLPVEEAISRQAKLLLCESVVAPEEMVGHPPPQIAVGTCRAHTELVSKLSSSIPRSRHGSICLQWRWAGQCPFCGLEGVDSLHPSASQEGTYCLFLKAGILPLLFPPPKT